jgi:hypothetical protein
MFARLQAIAIAISLCSCVAGCTPVGCRPKELFSWIDRNCFVADWTNHHSCVSCCRNGNCGQAYPNVQYPMLVLGDQPAIEAPAQSSDGGYPDGIPIEGAYETTSDGR